MYIYHIRQTQVRGWDTYSEAIVIAACAADAIKMHPRSGDVFGDPPPDCDLDPLHPADAWMLGLHELEPDAFSPEWATSPTQVDATYVGSAGWAENTPRVVCASFHAG